MRLIELVRGLQPAFGKPWSSQVVETNTIKFRSRCLSSRVSAQSGSWIEAADQVARHNFRLEFFDRPLHACSAFDQSLHVAHINPAIPAGWQRTAGQEVNIRVLAADEQDSFSRLDAGVNFRRKHIADEGIAQRDQVHIDSEEKSRKILQRNQARSVNGHAPRAKLAFDAIGFRSRGIQPEPKAVLRLTEVSSCTLR